MGERSEVSCCIILKPTSHAARCGVVLVVPISPVAVSPQHSEEAKIRVNNMSHTR